MLIATKKTINYLMYLYLIYQTDNQFVLVVVYINALVINILWRGRQCRRVKAGSPVEMAKIFFVTKARLPALRACSAVTMVDMHCPQTRAER